MSHYIIGTAGHVDHGKSTLIRALTGIDTDRLPEEKARGLSIDLGFAHLELPGGVMAGIVDVPGHERFLKNMLAGVGGYDLALLVVDAQEGVMPQTREHVEILELLRTRAGVVALNKVDAVDDDFLDLVEEELRKFLGPTFLGRAPVVRVSALTGRGLDELRRVLADELRLLKPRDPEGPFRLPVDRVFVKAGFGTVVTGSLWSGRLRQGDRVEILPLGLSARVRGLQVHARPVEEALAGQRVAVNLSGVEPGSLRRGLVLAPPGLMTPTHRLDAHLEVLAGVPRPVKSRTRVRFYAGTAENIGRLALLEGEALAAGSSGWVQILLEEPAVVMPGDRFVLRDFTASYTVGGGEVVDPAPPRHRRGDRAVLEALEARRSGGVAQALLGALERAAGGVRAPAALAQELQMPLGAVEELAAALEAQGKLVRLGRHLALAGQAQAAESALVALLGRLQQAAPWKAGWRKEEILRLLASPAPRLMEEVLAEMVRQGRLQEARGLLCLPGHLPRLDAAGAAAAQKVEKLLGQAGFSPPDWKDVPGLCGLDGPTWKVVEEYLLGTGRATRVSADLVYLESTLDEARARIAERIRREGSITPAQARDILATTRRYVIPLLEYFDQSRFTLRAGDARVLCDPGFTGPRPVGSQEPGQKTS
ncbi:MAG TPA: selenocysteine-specific translation elongation factor [Candidatus Nitrosotenuis sp.]|nr:selenocysteine-specific translation elongation factor [Candidatus Nitrosotenuis sp.]